MACSGKKAKNPCRPAGEGPGCQNIYQFRRDPPGGGPDGDSYMPDEDTDGRGGLPIEDDPDSIAGEELRPCCPGCGSGDGGTSDGGTAGEEVDPGSGSETDARDDETAEEPRGLTVRGGDQPPNKGAADKNKCIEDKRKEHSAKVQKCLCDCLQLEPEQLPMARGQNGGSGAYPWCWGKCIEENDIDFTPCFCMETICGGGGGGSEDEDDDGDTGGGGDDPGSGTPTKPDPRYEAADFGPKIKEIGRISSSYERVIPRVWGHGIVGLNVTWMGEPRVVTKCVGRIVENGDEVTVSSTYITQTYVDLAATICVGPIAGITHLWINDNLVFNNTLTASDTTATALIENAGFFNKTDRAADLYDRTTMELRVYNGDEDQTPDPLIGDIAYRGTAYIVLRNLEMTNFGENLPTIKVGVAQTGTTDPIERVSVLVDGPLKKVQSALLWYDQVERRLYVGGEPTAGAYGNGVRILDYDTLEEVDQLTKGVTRSLASDLDPKTFFMANSGICLMQTGSGAVGSGTRPLVSIIPKLNQMVGSYGAVAGATRHTVTDIQSYASATCLSPLRIEGEAIRDYMFIGANSDIALMRVSDAFAKAEREFPTALANISSYVLQSLVAVEHDYLTAAGDAARAQRVYGLGFPALNTSVLGISAVTAYDSDASPLFNPEQTSVESTIPASWWGGQSSGVSLRTVFADVKNQSLYIILALSSGGVIIRWNFATKTVLWATRIASPPTVLSPGPRTTASVTGAYQWVGSDDKLYEVNLRSGAIKTRGAVTRPLGGAQFYDADTQSITYITDADQVARVFLGRVVAVPTSVGKLARDLMLLSGLRDSEIDTSALDGVTIRGYTTSSNTSVQGILAQLSIVNDAVFKQREGQLIVNTHDDTAAVAVPVDEAMKQNDGFLYTLSTLVEADAIRSVRVEYIDADAGLATNIQVASNAILPPEGVSTGDIIISYPITMTGREAVVIAERILYDTVVNVSKIGLTLPASRLNLEPGDYVVIDGQTMMLEELTIGSDKSVALIGTRSDTGAYEEAYVTVTDGNRANETNDTSVLLPAAARIIPIPTNAALPGHARQGYESTSAMYAAVTGGVATIYGRNSTGVFVSVGTPTRELDWGTAETVLPNPVSVYSTDFDTEFVVRFTTANVASRFVAMSAFEFGENLLYVAGEFIQFKAWTVDPDGKTLRFTQLTRGRHGTEPHMASHAVGDFVAVYSPETWVLVEREAVDPLGDTFVLATKVGAGSSEVYVSYGAFVDHDMLKFYGPANMRRSLFVTGDILINFVRRNRVEGPDDLSDVIPDEIRDIAYRTYILSDIYNEALFLADLETSTGYIRRSYSGVPILYSFSEQAIDGFNSATHTLHVVSFQTPDPSDEAYPVPRGHPNYRAISPSAKW